MQKKVKHLQERGEKDVVLGRLEEQLLDHSQSHCSNLKLTFVAIGTVWAGTLCQGWRGFSNSHEDDEPPAATQTGKWGYYGSSGILRDESLSKSLARLVDFWMVKPLNMVTCSLHIVVEWWNGTPSWYTLRFGCLPHSILRLKAHLNDFQQSNSLSFLMFSPFCGKKSQCHCILLFDTLSS